MTFQSTNALSIANFLIIIWASNTHTVFAKTTQNCIINQSFFKTFFCHSLKLSCNATFLSISSHCALALERAAFIGSRGSKSRKGAELIQQTSKQQKFCWAAFQALLFLWLICLGKQRSGKFLMMMVISSHVMETDMVCYFRRRSIYIVVQKVLQWINVFRHSRRRRLCYFSFIRVCFLGFLLLSKHNEMKAPFILDNYTWHRTRVDVGGSKIRWYKELHSGWKTTQNCLISETF